MLHITNGDSVIRGFREAALPGEYLAWSDPLHDGPVPMTSSLDELSAIRAAALAGFGWGACADIKAAFEVRDRTLGSFRDHDEVVLWFEHDLFDRLLLMQLLAWFSTRQLGPTRLSLVYVDSHPEVHPFYGLGQLTGRQLTELFPGRRPVEADRLDTARNEWRAFCAPEPPRIAGLTRLLEEYPSREDGLSRTQWQLLRAAASGLTRKAALYRASQSEEESPWGDSSVFLRLESLAAGTNPAVDRIGPDEFAINGNGKRLLDGKLDWIDLQGGIDVWIGGVHLKGREPRWRWSRSIRELS